MFMDMFQLTVTEIFRSLCLVCSKVILFEEKNLCRGLLSTDSGKQGLPDCRGTSSPALQPGSLHGSEIKEFLAGCWERGSATLQCLSGWNRGRKSGWSTFSR